MLGIQICLLTMLVSFGGSRGELISSAAYNSEQEAVSGEVPDYFFEGFETVPNAFNPWNGQFPWKFLVFSSKPAFGEKSLIGFSDELDAESYVISPLFNVPSSEPFVIAESYIHINDGGCTWQFVPQGNEFIMARLIINPDGRVSVFDASTHGATLDIPFQFELSTSSSHVKCTFILERFRNRYSLFLNDQRMHTGIPFSTDLKNMVFVCGNEIQRGAASIDDVSVRPYATNVPTLSTWGLLLLISTLVGLAVWQQRRQRDLLYAAN